MKTIGVYEAKTHLAALLDQIEAGETIGITRHGVLVAQIAPAGGRAHRPVSEVIADLRAYRKNLRLRGLSVRKMIEEGRR